jgi:signal transduction histidine kinase
VRAENLAPAGLVNDCWRLHAEDAAARGIVFENALPADLECSADRGILSLVIGNLLDNAAAYTNDGGTIRAEVAGERPVEIVFSNTGCRLGPDQVARVFDRFWRGDPSRAGTGAHCGLGLALVQRAMRAIGGTATASIREEGVFAVRLSFAT